jgi:hypothetical protein
VKNRAIVPSIGLVLATIAGFSVSAVASNAVVKAYDQATCRRISGGDIIDDYICFFISYCDQCDHGPLISSRCNAVTPDNSVHDCVYVGSPFECDYYGPQAKSCGFRHFFSDTHCQVSAGGGSVPCLKPDCAH